MSSRITAAQLQQEIDAANAPRLLDVRTVSEYERAHIPGARNAPFWSVALLRAAARNDRVPGALVVYCTLGPRASWAKWTLWLAGHRNVRLLEGHMAGWQASGRRVVSGPTPHL